MGATDSASIKSEQYLRAILATVARQTFTIEQITSVVVIGADPRRQAEAYNLCDGANSQGEVAKAVGLDHGNFSRTVARWVDAGIVIRVGEGANLKPVHIYPLPDSVVKKAKAKNGQ